MIHVSLEDAGEHEKWAQKETFPWLTLPKEEIGEFIENLSGRGVPYYVLVDFDGNVIAQGSGAVFDYIKQWK